MEKSNKLEYLVWVDAQWELVPSLIERSRAHIEGIIHPSEHVWIYNKAGDILVQKRSASKANHPNKLDVSVAGHTSSAISTERLSKTLSNAAAAWALRRKSAWREIREELKGSLRTAWDNLACIGLYTTNDPKNNEHIAQYVLRYDGAFSDLQFDTREVVWLESIPLEALESDLLLSEGFQYDLVTRDPHYYAPVFRAIRKRLGLPPNQAFEAALSTISPKPFDFEPPALPISEANSGEIHS